MMYRLKSFKITIFTSIFISCLATSVMAEENKILLLYDVYKEYGTEDNKLNSITKVALASGNAVDIKNIAVYKGEDLSKYKAIIISSFDKSTRLDKITKALVPYRGGIIWIGHNFEQFSKDNSKYRSSDRFFMNRESVSYIPRFSSNNSSYVQLKQQISNITAANEYIRGKQYIIIDKLYPFVDLNELVAKVDFLYSKGIPFILSVMPVYDNTNQESMKKFAEALRYAQSKGGTIVMHSSLFYRNNVSGEEVKEKINLAFSNYINYGVYPVALDVPEAWLYKSDFSQNINSTNTLFLEKDKSLGILDFNELTLAGFNAVIEKIEVNKDNEMFINSTYSGVAYSINSDTAKDDFKKKVNLLLEKGISARDITYLNNRLTLNSNTISSRNSQLFLNDKPISGAIFTSREELEAKDTVKNLGFNNKKLIDISIANNLILFIITGVCVVFIIIALISIRIDRKKYFK